MNLTNEQIAKAKECKSAEELLKYADEIGYKLTEDEAKRFFNDWHKEGELADEELSNVAGGSTCINGSFYSDEGDRFLITTYYNSCPSYERRNGAPLNDEICFYCSYCQGGDPTYYCHARSIYSDPYNSEIGEH